MTGDRITVCVNWGLVWMLTGDKITISNNQGRFQFQTGDSITIFPWLCILYANVTYIESGY